jgi:hypothetical protein
MCLAHTNNVNSFVPYCCFVRCAGYVLVDGGEPLCQLQALTPANESVLVYTAGVYNSAYATHKFCDIMTVHSNHQSLRCRKYL